MNTGSGNQTCRTQGKPALKNATPLPSQGNPHHLTEKTCHSATPPIRIDGALLAIAQKPMSAASETALVRSGRHFHGFMKVGSVGILRFSNSYSLS